MGTCDRIRLDLPLPVGRRVLRLRFATLRTNGKCRSEFPMEPLNDPNGKCRSGFPVESLNDPNGECRSGVPVEPLNDPNGGCRLEFLVESLNDRGVRDGFPHPDPPIPVHPERGAAEPETALSPPLGARPPIPVHPERSVAESSVHPERSVAESSVRPERSEAKSKDALMSPVPVVQSFPWMALRPVRRSGRGASVEGCHE